MVERGLTNTLDTVQNYLALIRQNKRRLDMRTGPESIQIYREVSAFIHSCQFYLKSMPLSEVNLVMLENRAIALQGLILLNKKCGGGTSEKPKTFLKPTISTTSTTM